MIDKRLKQLWPKLQSKKPHMPNFISEIRLHGIRGINSLKIVLDYPVTVIAGGNASGKSTVLFAAACAYKVPGTGPKDYVPSTLFPGYHPKHGVRSDERTEITIDYEYATPDGRISMRWLRRKKGWSRSFFGRKKAKQPSRVVYLRTLSNLSNPSEVRGVLRMSHLTTLPKEEPLTAAQIDFAQKMLPFQYGEVVKLSGGGGKSLLFAANRNGASYSELHMAAGERAILRLSREIAQLEDALVLIDEVEAGLHPWVQQLLMLQLQQLALRNNLQIIVTSHSPVVLDSVPGNARIFLERDEQGNVEVRPPYRDIIQDALYGRSSDALNLLCEDKVAEGILYGIIDVLSHEQNIRSGSVVRIGRDTGAQEFPGHAAAFKKFGLVENFVFILDGDQRGGNIAEEIREAAGSSQIPVFFLPGDHAPEIWVWDCLKTKPDLWAQPQHLSMDRETLAREMSRLDATYDSASDRPSQIAKAKIGNLAESLHQDATDICRMVAKFESGDKRSDIQPLVEALKDILLQWRAE